MNHFIYLPRHRFLHREYEMLHNCLSLPELASF